VVARVAEGSDVGDDGLQYGEVGCKTGVYCQWMALNRVRRSDVVCGGEDADDNFRKKSNQH